MSSTLSTARRFGATLLIAGIAAFGSVAIAPAASADESAVVQPAPVVEEPAAEAPVVADDKPAKAPKICTDEDLEKHAKDTAKWSQQASMLSTLAAKARAAADALREQSVNLKPHAKKLADLLANGMDKAADKLDAQAQALLDKIRFGLACTVVGAPRF